MPHPQSASLITKAINQGNPSIHHHEASPLSIRLIKNPFVKVASAVKHKRETLTTLTATVKTIEKHKQKIEQQETNRRREILDEAFEILRDQFVDDIDLPLKSIHRRLHQRPLKSDVDVDKSLYWLFSRTEDPFTRYLPKQQLNAMQSDIEGSMCGVGLIFTAERRYYGLTKRIIIKQVVPQSPADKAGLRCGDRITAIDMIDVGRLSFDETTTKLLGQEGRKVLVTFKRLNSNQELSVLLERQKFEVPTVSVEIIGDIGYIQIREFASNTCIQVEKALRTIRKNNNAMSALILDLRGNSGGLVDKAVEVAKLFLNENDIIVRFIGRDNHVFIEKCNRQMPWLLSLFRSSTLHTEPVIVLVDGETASASELVAAAVRDNCRGIVVGRNTFGKGSVQAIVPLSNGGGAAVTVARYRTPKDEGISAGNGIQPDWLKDDLGDEGTVIVESLFGNRPQKRMNWLGGKLKKCNSDKCRMESKERMEIERIRKEGEKTNR